jgi:hypothetical protein
VCDPFTGEGMLPEIHRTPADCMVHESDLPYMYQYMDWTKWQHRKFDRT